MKRLVFWVFVGTLTAYASLAYLTTYVTTNSRKGCDRGNVSRQSDYDNWIEAARTRAATGLNLPKGDPNRRLSLHGAEVYEANALEPVRVLAAQGLAKSPGSPQTNCSAAYPYPLPWLGQ